jgi:hypothetical protein
MRDCFLCFFVLFGLGCTSTSTLPQSISEMDFSNDGGGLVDVGRYVGVIALEGVSVEKAIESSLDSLSSCGFYDISQDANEPIVFAVHPSTAYHFNMVVGLYFKPNMEETLLKVIVQASTPLSFPGTTGTRIYDSMRIYKRLVEGITDDLSD